jgi:hypothetical protein
MAMLKASDIRMARAFLRKRGIGSSEISPRKFAASSRETGKTFAELLAFIGRLYDGRQNQASVNREILIKAA